MTLYFALRTTGGGSIGFFEAKRIRGVDEADSINTYEIRVSIYKGNRGPGSDSTFTVDHRFGDGPFSLVAKALAIAPGVKS